VLDTEVTEEWRPRANQPQTLPTSPGFVDNSEAQSRKDLLKKQIADLMVTVASDQESKPQIAKEPQNP
jgi:hypothetical protein